MAAIDGIDARTPAALRTMRWVRAKAIIDRSSNAPAASSQPQCARPITPTDRLTVVCSNHPKPINAPTATASVMTRANGRRRRPPFERSPLAATAALSGGGTASGTTKAPMAGPRSRERSIEPIVAQAVAISEPCGRIMTHEVRSNGAREYGVEERSADGRKPREPSSRKGFDMLAP